MQNRFNAEYVDSITESGPNLILAEQKNPALVDSILQRIDISVQKHSSVGIAIVGHYDCVGNPASQETQFIHIQKSVEFLRQEYPGTIIGLWLDHNWNIYEVGN